MKKLTMMTSGLAGASLITITGVGMALADTSSMINKSVVPGNIYKTERQAAASEVLNTSVANIQSAHKNHTMKQLITAAGLTEQSYHDKLKTQLTSDLKAKGYSDQQISKVEQHHRHHQHAVNKATH